MSNPFTKKKANIDTKAATTAVTEDDKKAASIRSALYETQGGSSGDELQPDEVKKRDTIYGN